MKGEFETGREGKGFVQFGVELFMDLCIACLLVCLFFVLPMNDIYSYQGSLLMNFINFLRNSCPAPQRVFEAETL